MIKGVIGRATVTVCFIVFVVLASVIMVDLLVAKKELRATLVNINRLDQVNPVRDSSGALFIPNGVEDNYAKGEVLLKFRDSQELQDYYSVASNIETGLESIDTLSEKYKIKKMERLVGLPQKDGYKASVLKEELARSSLIYKIEVQKDQDIKEIVEEYQKNPYIEYAEPNYIQYLAVTANDPEFDSQWGLHNTGQIVNGITGTDDADIDALEAWSNTTGSNSVTVAIIDSGADLDHPDLTSNLIAGWDYIEDDSDPEDLNGHGTHVAGIIGAIGNNSAGITGVNWSVKMMPLRIFNEEGLGYTSDFIAALGYAVTNGIKIVNYSGGGHSASQALSDSISDARDNGVLLMAAAMNDSADNDGETHNYPSDYELDNIIAVAATNQNDGLASFSNYGVVSVDVGAPGVNIYSTIPDDDYGYMHGTSMATPFVTGLAALLKAHNPDYTYLGIKNNIIENVDELDSLAGKVVSGGRINAYKAFIAIDTRAPTAVISYSTAEFTNQDVIVTLVPSEPVIVSNNEGVDTYTFTENSSFTFEFTDLAGNPGSATATVNNIDKVAPTDPTAYRIYSDSSMIKYLTPGIRYIYPNPYFKWTGAFDEDSGVKGYYVSLEITDPDDDSIDVSETGIFQGSNVFSASEITEEDTYYFYLKVVDQAGNFSQGTYLPYIFSPRKTLGQEAGDPFIVTGTKQGGGPEVRILTPDGELLKSFDAYENSFWGGINVAVGDIDGNGENEVVTSTREGGVPTIKVFDVEGNNLGWDFDAYDPGFRGGINIAVGDIEGDGLYEIAIAPISSGGPNIRIFGLRDGQIIPTTENFMAYDENFRGGIAISIGDLEGDGTGEIITTPTSKGGPHIRVFGLRDGKYEPVTLGIMAYDENFRGGINSCVGDVNNNGKDEIMTGIVSNGGPHVRIFGNGRSGELELLSPGFMAFNSSLRGGVSVTTVDTSGDGYSSIVAGMGGSGDPVVRIFDDTGKQLSPEFKAYSSDYKRGLTLAAGNF